MKSGECIIYMSGHRAVDIIATALVNSNYEVYPVSTLSNFNDVAVGSIQGHQAAIVFEMRHIVTKGWALVVRPLCDLTTFKVVAKCERDCTTSAILGAIQRLRDDRLTASFPEL